MNFLFYLAANYKNMKSISKSFEISLKSIKKAGILFITVALIVGGFFSPSSALAAHTATVTVSPTLVKGGTTGTYTFTIGNDGSSTNFIDDIVITVPTGFSIGGSLVCPTNWGAVTTGLPSSIECLGSANPSAGKNIAIGASANVSFTATAPGTNSIDPWSVLTEDNNFDQITNNPVTTVDATAPTISTITTKDTDNDGRVDTATIVFSEPVDDSTFAPNDFSVGGSAGTSFSGTEDDNTIDIVVAGGVAGTEAKDVTYTKSAGVGADMVGNLLDDVATGDEAETDAAAPVAVSAETKTTTTIDVTFSEDLNGSSDSPTDFTVADNTITATSELNGVVTLTLENPIATNAAPLITVNGNGVDSGLEDLNNNWTVEHSVASTDGIAPTFTAETKTTTTIEVTFSENVDGGTAANAWTIDGDNAVSATDPAGTNNLVLTVAAMGTGDTPEVVYVAANGDIADTATNEVADGTSDMAEDGIAPTVVISSTATSPTNTSPIPMTVTFSEDVTGFEIGDIVVVNGTKADFVAVNDSTYTFNVTPTDQGAVTVDIAGGVAQDAVANNNTVATQFSIVFDDVEPDAPVIVSIATNELINNAEKTAIVVEGTAEANSLVTVVLSDGTNSVMNTEQLSGGDTTFSITLDGTSFFDIYLKNPPRCSLHRNSPSLATLI